MLHSTEKTQAQKLIEDVRASVNQDLSTILNTMMSEVQDKGPIIESIVQEVVSLLRRGGKRLRPALMVAGFRVCGGQPKSALEAQVIEASCAWELVQAYFLIQDDWMDQDELRRGSTTAHVQLTQKFEGDKHLGASTAILASDYASAWAHRVLTEATPNEYIQNVLRVFSHVHQDVVIGQMLDLTMSSYDRISLEQMHRLKTSSYSVEGPLLIGSIFANATQTQQKILMQFAKAIGIAFQLRDDWLGVFGNSMQTGKSNRNDICTGKRTALLIETMERCSNEDATQLRCLLASITKEKTVLSQQEAAWVFHLMQQLQVEQAIERRIQNLVQEAKHVLENHFKDFQEVQLLNEMAHVLTYREM